MIRGLAFLALFLSSCSTLTPSERAIVGTWYWQKSVEDFGASGFVTLNSDRSNIYKITSTNPTERIVLRKNEIDGRWRLREERVCIATRWIGRTIISRAKVKEEKCYWKVVTLENGEVSLVLTYEVFLEGDIVARRK